MKKTTYSGEIYQQRRRNSTHEDFSNYSAKQIGRMVQKKITHSRSEEGKIEIKFKIDKNQKVQLDTNCK